MMEDEVVDLTSEADLSQSKANAVSASPISCRSLSPQCLQRRGSFAKPWWNRMPHFVPVAAISYDDYRDTGIDPRTGEEVFVDYLHQFAGSESEERPSGLLTGHKSLKQKTTRSERLSSKSIAPTGGKWVTNERGKQVFQTSDGKEYTGMEAYGMHAKLVSDKGE